LKLHKQEQLVRLLVHQWHRLDRADAISKESFNISSTDTLKFKVTAAVTMHWSRFCMNLVMEFKAQGNFIGLLKVFYAFIG
jgi:hypothetical protein